MDEVRTFELQLTLVGAKPGLWRRLRLPASLELARISRVLQVAVGGDLEWKWAFGVLPASWWGPETTLEQIAAKVEAFALVAAGDGGPLVLSVRILADRRSAPGAVGVTAGAGRLRAGPVWPGRAAGAPSALPGFDLASTRARVRAVLASDGG